VPHQRRTFSSTRRQNTFSILEHRALIRLAGRDVAAFLDGLLPAKLLHFDATSAPSSPIYTAFLTAQGRILVDVFVYPPSCGRGASPGADSVIDGEGAEWYLECDAESVDLLMKHLKKHKLRSKFTLQRVDYGASNGAGEHAIAYVFPDAAGNAVDNVGGLVAGGRDPRPGMGARYVSGAPQDQMMNAFGEQEHDLNRYHLERMAIGMAEGQKELISEHSLPQESNIDLLGGIDFHKGCYLGQELTIRTHHTGVVRKRVLPVQLYEEALPPEPEQKAPKTTALELPLEQWPPAGSNLSKSSSRRGRSTGKLLSHEGSVGLALCRLEMMTDIKLTGDATNYSPEEQYTVGWTDAESVSRSLRVKPFVPDWLRDGIEANLRRKERKPGLKKAELDDEDVD
jgi:folate-binding protein YgfZ